MVDSDGFLMHFSDVQISRLPFNWKHPFGYAVALSLQCIDAYYAAICGVSLTCYSVGSCYMLTTFVNDITNDLSVLSSKTITSDANYEQKAKQFNNIVQEFSTVKELSRLIIAPSIRTKNKFRKI